MATRNNWQDDEEINGQKVTDLQNGVIGGAGAVPQAGTAAKGTGWTNLQQYLDTNKGAGNAIADKQLADVTQKTGEASQAIDTWANQANDEINKGIKTDSWSDKINGKSTADIAGTFTNANNKAAFNAWKNQPNYGGPADSTGLTGYGDTAKLSGDAVNKIELSNTLAGQEQIAKDVFGKEGKYSSGMAKLDSFLARGDAQGKFDQFKTQNSGFKDKLGNVTKGIDGADGSIAKAKQQGDGNYKSVMDAIAGRIKGIDQDTQTRADEANAQASADAQKYGALSYGFNPNFKSTTSTQPYLTTANKMDMVDQAELDALNSLGGMDDDLTTGGYAKGTGSARFDEAGYNKAISDEFAEWSKQNPTPAPSPKPPATETLIPKAPTPDTYNGEAATPVQNADGSIDWYDKYGNKIN